MDIWPSYRSLLPPTGKYFPALPNLFGYRVTHMASSLPCSNNMGPWLFSSYHLALDEAEETFLVKQLLLSPNSIHV
jgi:hypothetical protein